MACRLDGLEAERVVIASTYLDYPVGTKYQPQEHELPRAHLLELDLTLEPKP